VGLAEDAKRLSLEGKAVAVRSVLLEAYKKVGDEDTASRRDDQQGESDEILAACVDEDYLFVLSEEGLLVVLWIQGLTSDSSIIACVKCSSGGEDMAMWSCDDEDQRRQFLSGLQGDDSQKKKKKRKRKKKKAAAGTDKSSAPTENEPTENPEKQHQQIGKESGERSQPNTQLGPPSNEKKMPTPSEITNHKRRPPQRLTRLLIALDNGHFQEFTFNHDSKQLNTNFTTPVPIHKSVITGIEYRGDSRHVVSVGMDYQVCQYSLDEKRCISTFNVEQFLKTKSAIVQSGNKLFNPPSPQCIALSYTIRNEQGLPKYGAVGLISGDILVFDLDQNIVVRRIAHAHNYIVSCLHFCDDSTNEELSIMSASNDGHIRSFRFKFPKTIKERNSPLTPVWEINHPFHVVAFDTACRSMSKEDLEQFATNTARINVLLVLNNHLVVGDTSGQIYCYSKK